MFTLVVTSGGCSNYNGSKGGSQVDVVGRVRQSGGEEAGVDGLIKTQDSPRRQLLVSCVKLKVNVDLFRLT